MSDKRTVHTDALDTLGMIHPSQQFRDAIHLAVEPVVAGETLYPGQDISLVDGQAFFSAAEKKLGIVDPFLTTPVYPGQSFWLVVYPRKITSLRHVWSHPDFAPDEAPDESDDGLSSADLGKLFLRGRGDQEPPQSPENRIPIIAPPGTSGNISRADSQRYIEEVATNCDSDYDSLMKVLEELVDDTWSCISMGENETYKDYYEQFEENSPLWDHFTNLTGKVVPVDHRSMPFICSC